MKGNNMAILDRRKAGKNKSAENRQRFIKRYKTQIKKAIDDIGKDGNITDIMKDRKIKIPAKDLNEPWFHLDSNTGSRDIVLPGNKTLNKGDKIDREKKGKGKKGNQGSNSGESEDEFSFVLSKEEFFELYFSDMALPDFVKESMKDTTKFKLKRSGYIKEGTPARIDLVKTFKQALARRIATKSERFLDTVDLRYRHYVKKPYPIVHAKIFFLMDVSASMGAFEKMLAKKFFLLLYLFLVKEYKKVEVSFIRHTQEAKEVEEEEFFYGRESGGTEVSSGLRLINEIIDKEVIISQTNIYVAQASDGDNFDHDNEACLEELAKLLPKVQYYAYVQTEDPEIARWKARNQIVDLYSLYKPLADSTPKFNIQKVRGEEDVYPVLRELFSK